MLWKKVLPRLSAGRVQSVATRIVVERERARMLFKSAEYWDVEGTVPGRRTARTATRRPSAPPSSPLDDRRVATGRDFDPATGQRPSNVLHLDEAGARGLAARLDGRPFEVVRVEEKPYRRRPYAPFMTSTLQQEGSRKLRWSSATTMRVAQRLYENGYITYMRTDSTNLSETALAAARQQARELYGDAYVPAEARTLHPQGQERPGGARGDPPGRRLVPHAGRAAQPALERRVPPLRADLAAHAGLADGRRGRDDGVGAHRRHIGHRRARGVLHVRAHDHVPGLPARLRRGHRRAGRPRRTTPRSDCRNSSSARR